jgi:predicted Zn-dependent protease with MMP-like domain
LGIITNIINTLFTTQGADQAAGAADRVGRSQTRLGQASASAGRQFAAQASGLGGLVAAYAGAAATTFALQAAFTALANAARAGQTFEGLNALAANVGVSGTQLLASVREITNNQLTLAEAAAQVNLSLSAGFSTDQIEGLSSVAIKASRALGRDLTDAMTRVVRGSAKMETELLDELGIYTKIEPATRAYATALGKSVGDLTEFERRQAFANAVIAEGERKFASINTTIPTSAEQIEAFGVKIQDLTTQMGILLADTLAPLASFLTNNAAAAFSALGIAISLAAGKGIQVLSAGLQSLTASIEAAGLNAENFVRKITGVQGAATAASTAIKDLTVDTLRLNDAEKARITTIQGAAASRNLSRSEIKQSNALITKSISVLNAEKTAEEGRRNAALAALNTGRAALDAKRADFEAARTNLRNLQQQGASTSALTAAQSQLASAQGRLGAATAAFNNIQGANVATLTASRAAVLGLNADITRLQATLITTTAAANGFRAAIAGFLAGSGRAIANLAGGFSLLFTGIVAAASKIFFLVSILTLIGSSFANAIGKGEEFQALLNSVGQTIKSVFSNSASRQAKSAIQGITAANLAELEKTNSELRNVDSFTFKKKIVGIGVEVEITKTKEELASEVTKLLTQATQGTEKTLAGSATSGKAIGTGIAAAIGAALFSFLPGIGTVIGGKLGVAIALGLGGALGTIWDYFSDVPEIPAEISSRIRSQFTDSLAGLDEGVQDKIVGALATLEDRYGAAARFDPAARAALKVQQQLVLEGAKYLDKIEAVSELMLATGQTADKIVKNFDFSKAQSEVSYISEAITSLRGREFSFKFFDLQDQSLQALMDAPITFTPKLSDNILTNIDESFRETVLADLTQLLQGVKQEAIDTGATIEKVLASDKWKNAFGGLQDGLVGAGLSFEELVKLAESTPQKIAPLRASVESATGAYNSFQQSQIRSLEVQRQLVDSLENGTATLESFSQGISNSRTAILEAEQAYYESQKEIDNLRSKLESIREYNPELAKGLEDYINRLIDAQNNTLANISAQKRLTEELKAQEAILKNQIVLSSFLKSFTKEAKNPLSLALDFASVGSENVLATQIGFLSQFVTATEDQIKAYNELSKQIQPLELAGSVQQKILSTAAKDAADLVADLKKIPGITDAVLADGKITVTKTLTDATKVTETFSLLEDATGSLVQTNNDAAKAINELIRQAVENLPQVLNEKTTEINKLIDSTRKEIEKLASEEYILRLKFEADVQQLKNDIGIIAQESLIEQIELQIDLTKARVDSGKLTKAEGASEETRLRKELLTEQAILLGQQFQNESMAIEARRTIMEAESAARSAAIETEAKAQRQKLINDLAYILALRGLYTAAIKGLGDTSDRQVAGIIQAGNNVSDSWAKTLSEGATALNAAIVSGFAGSTAFNSEVSGASAEAVELPKVALEGLTNASVNFVRTTVQGLKAVTELETARKTAETEALKRNGELLDLEQQKALANFEARIRANELLSEIEQEAAIAREREALKSGGKADKQIDKIEERLKALFDAIKGSIENALMSLNDLIFYGEGNFGDIMSNLFKSIQKDLFKITIADPLSDFLTTKLFAALGVKKGTDGLTYEGNALLVKLVNPLDLPTQSPSTAGDGANKATDIFGGFFDQITSMFSRIFGQGGIVANLFTALFGQGGILSGLFKGLVSFLGSIFGFSQGGMVHLAQGGAAVSASLMRDRVPAMLEPGEFVIRKQSARKIGMPALQAMNATGNMAGGGGNVFINVTNEGSPKQAEASAPKFDGEKYVVDIVMRDISNNGPIRRSLRGRGGL